MPPSHIVEITELELFKERIFEDKKCTKIASNVYFMPNKASK